MNHLLCYSLRAKISNGEKWKSNVIIDPNELLRQLENKNISVVFVCSNDLKHSIHVAHLPFLCRLTGTKLVVLNAGSAPELQSYFGKKTLFMFSISKNIDFSEFNLQFPEIGILYPNILPQMHIKK